MRTITVIGTRPEIIRLSGWEEEIIYTGQHFSPEMRDSFMDDTCKGKKLYYLPEGVDVSDVNVLMYGIVDIIGKVGFPDYIIVHGDTRSALAGARAAKKMNIKLVHTEAGVRSSDNNTEQRIRKEIDGVADINFCPIPQAVDNLRAEGITDNVYFVGDTLYDAFINFQRNNRYDFAFLTIHRRETVDDELSLRKIICSLDKYSSVVFPIHPHTKKSLEEFKIDLPSNVVAMEPLDHGKTLRYIMDAKVVLTDSGGVQREAYWTGTPCIVLRNDSEWNVCTKEFGEGDAGDKIFTILKSKEVQ